MEVHGYDNAEARITRALKNSYIHTARLLPNGRVPLRLDFKLNLQPHIFMASRVFALIIGIDTYQSGGIWNLHSCVEDAKKMKRWLMNGLNVPREQICLLLDSRATKQAIEDSFMEHLVNNSSIERGDSLVIYFAGHGSCLPAPPGWFQDSSNTGYVEVICPYDHDTKAHHGRNAGISDRSLVSLLEELESTKGSNITVFLDCCFSPNQTPANILDRSITRWTKTSKAAPEDLYRGLWAGARAKPHSSDTGIFNPSSSYTLLAACPPGHKAIEGKDGGRFTTAFLDASSRAPIHRTTYTRLVGDLLEATGESQKFICLGKHRDKVLFDDVPFTLDKSFSSAFLEEGTKLIKVDLGDIHGVVEGSQMALHLHNYRCSPNPPIAISIVTEVYPTYCLTRVKSQCSDMPKSCWAKITQWNNHRPFCVYLKSTFLSCMRMLKLKRSMQTKPGNVPVASFKNGVNILKVKEPRVADLSVTLGRKSIILVQNNPVVFEDKLRSVKIDTKNPVEVIDDAALFNLHLLRKNVDNPFRDLVDMELYRLDPASWSKVGYNYLHDGRATLGYENGAIYDIALHNKSKIDIWPYIFYMDPNRHRSTLIYNPDSSSKAAPLPGQGSLEIGAGRLGAEALSLALSQQNHVDFAYLKLYLSSAPVNMNLLQQDPFPQGVNQSYVVEGGRNLGLLAPNKEVLWDTALTSLMFVRHLDENRL